MRRKRHHERLDGQCLITMKGKMGIRRERKQNPRNQNGYKKQAPKMDAVFKYHIWNNTKWYWCGEESKGHCRGKWRTHLPTNCTNNKKKQQKTKMRTSDGNKRKTDTLKIKGAHQAVLEASEFAHEGMQFQTQDSGFESK